LQAISEGIENTNYFLDTRAGQEIHRWVVTLFENVEANDIPFFCALTRQLSQQGLSVPAPVQQRDGKETFAFKGKLGIIVPRFEGAPMRTPNEQACTQVGHWMARMHRGLSEFSLQRPLVRGIEWMLRYQHALTGKISDQDMRLLAHSIDRYAHRRAGLMQCPQGVVHGDLFHDNVLFDSGQISGVIDFYNACQATLIYDLAVAVNDWAVDTQGRVDRRLERAILDAYQSERPWTEQEHAHWFYALELAALRFWISRLSSKFLDTYQTAAVSGDVIKDPDEMKRILLRAVERQANA